MSQSVVRRIEKSVTLLRKENAALKKKLKSIQDKLRHLTNERTHDLRHAGNTTGKSAEKYLARLLNAKARPPTSGYDLMANGQRLEVKGSGLLANGNRYEFTKWAWRRLFGDSNSKRYDRLILCGVSNPAFRAKYRDAKSPYVFFDLSNEVARKLPHALDGGQLSIGTDPDCSRSTDRQKIWKRQITEKELIKLYGKHGGGGTGR